MLKSAGNQKPETRNTKTVYRHKSPSSMVLLLLPGMDGTGVFFERLVENLGTEIEPVIVSYPENEPLGYEGLLSYVTSCFPKENPFFILGESFSGPLAVMAAAKRPKNLKGVILVASFVRNPMPKYLYGIRGLLGTPVLKLRPKTRSLLKIFCPGVEAETRRWITGKMPRLPVEVVAARVRAVLEVNVREELKDCGIPVMYIAASRDRIVRRNSLEDIWLCRPDVLVKVLDGPHIILQTRPAEAAEVIKGFCSAGGKFRM